MLMKVQNKSEDGWCFVQNWESYFSTRNPELVLYCRTRVRDDKLRVINVDVMFGAGPTCNLCPHVPVCRSARIAAPLRAPGVDLCAPVRRRGAGWDGGEIHSRAIYSGLWQLGAPNTPLRCNSVLLTINLRQITCSSAYLPTHFTMSTTRALIYLHPVRKKTFECQYRLCSSGIFYTRYLTTSRIDRFAFRSEVE